MKKSGGEERKEEKERRATWLELFYDLVFVAVVTQLAENLDHNEQYFFNKVYPHKARCTLCSGMVCMDWCYFFATRFSGSF